MDLYVRRGLPNAADPEVIELSALLNSLQVDQSHATLGTLRNPNGVYLKLCNFRAKERPGHGMAHGNHLEHDLWDRFANNKADLNREAASIRSRAPVPFVDRRPGEPIPDNRRLALTELIKTLPIRESDGPKEATPLLMALIREAVELQVVLTTYLPRAAESRVAPAVKRRITNRLGTMLGLVADLSDTLHVRHAATPKRARLTGAQPESDGNYRADARKLVIFPCGDRSSVKHFNRTMRRPVDLTALGVNWDQLSKVLPTNYPLSQAHVWGVMPRSSGLNETRFRRCEVGDVALFTGNKKAFSASTIRATLRSAELARALWHTDVSGNTWELVFLLSEPIELELPYEVLSNALGYNSKFAFQAFFVLSEQASRRAMQALDSMAGHLGLIFRAP